MNKLQKFEYITILIAIGIAAFFGGHYFGKRGFDYELQINPPKVEFLNKRPQDKTIDFQQFWDVHRELNEKYLLTPLDQKKLLNGIGF
jgi:hypothetical protein